VITIDALVIWALTAHGREMRDAWGPRLLADTDAQPGWARGRVVSLW